MCAHTTMYVSSYTFTCVLIPLCMCAAEEPRLEAKASSAAATRAARAILKDALYKLGGVMVKRWGGGGSRSRGGGGGAARGGRGGVEGDAAAAASCADEDAAEDAEEAAAEDAAEEAITLFRQGAQLGKYTLLRHREQLLYTYVCMRRRQSLSFVKALSLVML
jgi:hypothetical protein